MKNHLLTIYFTLITLAATTQPANDDCSNAITLSPSATNTCSQVLRGDTREAVSTDLSCVGTNSKTVWYKFTATSDIHEISVKTVFSGGLRYMEANIYKANCATLTKVGSNCESVTFSDNVNLVLKDLTVDETYLVSVGSRFDEYNGQFDICINTPPPVPANDNCSNAISLIVNEANNCDNITKGSTFSATASTGETIPSCTANGANDDVWYKFTATATAHNIRLFDVTGTGTTDLSMALYKGDCGSLTQLICEQYSVSILNRAIEGLTIGSTYYVRIWTTFPLTTNAANFSICLSKAGNDLCSNATELTPSPNTTCSNLVTGNTSFAGTERNGCNNPEFPVWYTFKATAQNHSLKLIPSQTNGLKNAVIHVFNNNCDNLTEITNNCQNINSNDTIHLMMPALTIGNTYRISIAASTGGNSNGGFDICITTPAPPPPGDFCQYAIQLTPSVNDIPNFIRGSNYLATLDDISCVNNSLVADVWYKFTATSSSHEIFVESDMYRPQVQLLKGSCNNFTSLYCSFTSTSRFSRIYYDLFTLGEEYYLRVFNTPLTSGYPNATINQSGNFGIAITKPGTPANDECITAIPLPVCPAGNACNESRLFETSHATPGADISGCGGEKADDDIWFSFVATSGNISIAADVINNTVDMQLLSGTCNNLASIVCQTARNILNCPPLNVGQTYYLRMFSTSTLSLNGSAFRVKVYENEQYRQLESPSGVAYDTSCLSENLVLNGQFEDFTQCPVNYVPSATPGQTLLPNWKIPTTGTADHFRDCGNLNSPVLVPGNICIGHQEPRSGKAYTGIFTYRGPDNNYREYLEGTLSRPMEAGKKYLVSFYTSAAEYNNTIIDQLGIRFNSVATTVNSSMPLNQLPQIVSPKGAYISEKEKWVNIKAIFTADSAYTKLIIGNFNDAAKTNTISATDISGGIAGGSHPGCYINENESTFSYYFIDDVSVSEITGMNDHCFFNTTVPVNWLSFNARLIDQDVHLNWQTTNEYNCSSYQVERSSDGVRFFVIGSLLCYNNSGQNSYSFIDKNPGYGNLYYRIRQTDLNGDFNHSETKYIRITNAGNIRITPNPAQSFINIHAGTPIKKITISSINGNIVKNLVPKQDGRYNIQDLQSGMYIINIQTAGENINYKLLKQ
ncbi:T9SS type A sorting domain-containing protein [Polluticaenibacter yanchengensis]|uniref:T9SS type A sorting domain-containing protein n=1 Tax=Polluticaenibacter yanchengensis TaxID=3014562 RepID=A0ABT4UJZ8_9BACT|nr:T9SS type A sorting domain-containing protein [Chitinophagaceae bacterium LY-5]